jgi:hypothetical protein
LIGRCIEVWAAEDLLAATGGGLYIPLMSSAKHRFGEARSWWLRQAGVDERESWQLIPAGAPWSLEHRQQRGAGGKATTRLARDQTTLKNLPELRAEADALFAMAVDTRTPASPHWFAPTHVT